MDKPDAVRVLFALQTALHEGDAIAYAQPRVRGVAQYLPRAVVEPHAHFPARVARFALVERRRRDGSAVVTGFWRLLGRLLGRRHDGLALRERFGRCRARDAKS